MIEFSFVLAASSVTVWFGPVVGLLPKRMSALVPGTASPAQLVPAVHALLAPAPLSH